MLEVSFTGSIVLIDYAFPFAAAYAPSRRYEWIHMWKTSRFGSVKDMILHLMISLQVPIYDGK